jgi:hypothetical protein
MSSLSVLQLTSSEIIWSKEVSALLFPHVWESLQDIKRLFLGIADFLVSLLIGTLLFKMVV